MFTIIITLLIIFAALFIGGALYVAIVSSYDKEFEEECRKFQEEYQRKQKAKQEKKRAKWLRNEYEIFRTSQKLGTLSRNMTFEEWLR